VDYPEKNNDEWFCHVNLKKDEAGNMVLFKRPIEPYLIDINLETEIYDVAVR
jgi:succinate dehydrogenase/fumarate reductase flavoprotein subunit